MSERDITQPEPREQEVSEETIRMLIVDDDPEVGTALETYFESENYDVTRASDGLKALELLESQPVYDIVLLDVMLPKMNGFEVLEESQRRGVQAPVLMMSGRGGQENILKGFGLGAEDYLVKPFDPDELMARVRAILGRTMPPAGAPANHFRHGALEINFSTYEVTFDGQDLDLTELEFDLLRYLVLNRGHVVSRKRLLRDAWSIDEDVIIHTISPEVVVSKLEENITSLREKIEIDPSTSGLIEVVFGQGYRFNA